MHWPKQIRVKNIYILNRKLTDETKSNIYSQILLLILSSEIIKKKGSLFLYFSYYCIVNVNQKENNSCIRKFNTNIHIIYISRLPNNLCEFPTSTHKFIGLFRTKKSVLNSALKDFWKKNRLRFCLTNSINTHLNLKNTLTPSNFLTLNIYFLNSPNQIKV